MSDTPRDLRHPLRPPRTALAGEFHRRRPARRAAAARLLRLGDRRTVGHDHRRHRLRRGDGQAAPARADQTGGRGLTGDRHRSRGASRTSSSPICITTTAATTICFRARAITCRTARWPTRPDAACAIAALRLPFEADDVVAMVRKVFAGRVAFHDGDDEIAPGVTRAPHRRPFEGTAERARARRGAAR